MNNLINRYIAKEIITSFFLGLAAFTFVLLMGRILKLTELVVDKGVKVSEVLSLISYILPSFFVLTIPMAFLLAVLLAFGRLSADEEVTAIKSSGIGLFQMMPPVLLISVFTFTCTLLLMLYALPWGNHSFKTQIYSIVKRKADTAIVPGRVIDSFENMVLYVTEKNKKTGRLKGVLISEEKLGISLNTIVAKEGEVISVPDKLSVTLRLFNGTIHRKSAQDRLQYKVIDFEVYDITLSMDFQKDENTNVPKGDRELNISELFEKIKELKDKGISHNYLLVELHKKFSLPFACIVFAFIGAPLGIQGKRSGKAHGFVISLILIIIYWMFLLAGEGFGDRGTVTPFLSMWSANILFLSIGIYLLIKANNESEVKIITLFENLYALIARFFKTIFKR